MQRARGKVPTERNKDMVAAGSQNIPSKIDWGAHAKRVVERRNEGKPLSATAERRLQERPIQKQIIAQKEAKDIEKNERDH